MAITNSNTNRTPRRARTKPKPRTPRNEKPAQDSTTNTDNMSTDDVVSTDDNMIADQTGAAKNIKNKKKTKPANKPSKDSDAKTNSKNVTNHNAKNIRSHSAKYADNADNSQDDSKTPTIKTSAHHTAKPVANEASDADKIKKLEKELEALKSIMLTSIPENIDTIGTVSDDVDIEDATFEDIMRSTTDGELHEELFASDGETESTEDDAEGSDTILIDVSPVDDASDEESHDELDASADDEDENAVSVEDEDDIDNGETLLNNDDSGAVRVLDSLVYYEVQDWLNEKTGKPYNRIKLLQDPPRFIVRQHMTGDESGEDDSMVTLVVNRELAVSLSEMFTNIRRSFDGESLEKKREPFSWDRVRKSISDTWKYEPVKVVLVIIIVLILIAAVVYGAIVS